MPLLKNVSLIDPVRKKVLLQLTDFMQQRVAHQRPLYLNFICTHNSRRSHMAQLWAQTAALYYNVPNVTSQSGGTEATAFNPRAIHALQKAGFQIKCVKNGDNPIYEVTYSTGAPPVIAFSKKFEDPFNAASDFAAVMTCAEANESCPFVPGASQKIALPFADPKEADGTPQEDAVYLNRSLLIATEIFFAFSEVKV
jgi:arsenate reductase